MITHRHKVTTKVICLEDVRLRYGITNDDDVTRDSILESRILAAQSLLELEARHAFTQRQVISYADWSDYRIDLLRPFNSLTLVEYINEQSIWTVLDISSYRLDEVSSTVYIKTAPTDLYKTFNVYRITYSAGYLPDDIPEQLKEATHIVCEMWERSQHAIASGARPLTIPNAAMQLLSGFRDFRSNI